MHKFSRRQWAALFAEFLGLAIFQIYGGSANDEVAAFGNGITLAILSEAWPGLLWLRMGTLKAATGPVCLESSLAAALQPKQHS